MTATTLDKRMKFSVFDHMDRAAVPLHQQYAERLVLAEAYDAHGLHAYHVAEHHATPLGMAPSPSVYLAALAQRTRRLRFGPLVYTLSMHHPLRVAEEICMLDQLSGGRLEMGFGRGISPYELGYYGVDPAQAQSIYLEAFQVVMQALTQPQVDFAGEHFVLREVPIEMQCLQQPHPPRWYGAGNAAGAEWAATERFNIVANGVAPQVREITSHYRAHWAALGRDSEPLPYLGVSRHLVLADSEQEAQASASRAYACWHAHLMHLWKKHGTRPQTLAFPDTFAQAQQLGLGFAGTPEAAQLWLREQQEACGVNYLVCRLAFGDLTLEESLRSTRLLGEQVMPAWDTAHAEELDGHDRVR